MEDFSAGKDGKHTTVTDHKRYFHIAIMQLI